MKNLLITLHLFLVVGMLQAQVSKPKPTTKKTTTTTSKTAVKKATPAVSKEPQAVPPPPPAEKTMPEPAAAPTSQPVATQTAVTEDMQAQYDKAYNANNKKGKTTIKETPKITSKAAKETPKKEPKAVKEITKKEPKATNADATGYRSRSYIGLKAGGTYGILHSSDATTVGLSFLPRYTAGAFLNLPLGKTLAIQPEFNYTTIAYGGTDTDGTKASIGLNWVEFAMPFKLSFGSQTQLFLHLGPQLNYGLDITIAEAGNSDKLVLPMGETFGERTSFGAMAGIGAAFNRPNGQWYIEMRGNMNLGDFKNGLTKDFSDQFTALNLTIGYGLKMGR